MRVRRPRAAYLHPAAGSWRGSAPGGSLLRPPSPPIGAYQRLVRVPIGNDGIAFPAVFTAAGTAIAFAGPTGIGTVWEPYQAGLSTSVGPLDTAIATVYAGPIQLIGPVAPQFQVAALVNGGGAQVPLGGIQLVPGQFVWAVWTGGTTGALAYLNVTGAKQALVI